MRKGYGSYLSGIMGAVALVLIGMTRTASATVIFTGIPSPLPGNVASLGFEAQSVDEAGEGIALPAGTGGTLTTVKVVLSSWGCTSGHWFNPAPGPGSCVTTPGAKFNHPITMNIYTVDNTNPLKPKAKTLLGTQTKTFSIPYRPTSDTVHCGVGGTLGGNGTQWYSAQDNQCYHGLATPIAFDLTSLHIPLSSETIIAVAYNTTSYGAHPIGITATCFTNDNNCPYDSLNVSTDGSVFFQSSTPDGLTVGLGALATGNLPDASSVLDANGIFIRYANPASSCNTPPPQNTAGVLEDDTSIPQQCWTGFHPEIEVNATCGQNINTLCPNHIGGNSDENDDHSDGHGDGNGDGHGDSGHGDSGHSH